MSDVVVQEWRVTGDPGSGYPSYSFVWPRPGAKRHDEDPLDGEAAARAFYDGVAVKWQSHALEHRTVTYTPWETP